MEKDFLSINEFAKLISVHPQSVRTMIRKGRLSAFQVGGGLTSSYRIARTEVERLGLIDLQKIVNKMVEEKLKERK
jgi:excisionase family DNA binding protein